MLAKGMTERGLPGPGNRLRQSTRPDEHLTPVIDQRNQGGRSIRSLRGKPGHRIKIDAVHLFKQT